MISLDSLVTSAARPVRLRAVAAAAIVQFATVVYLGSSISGGDAYTYLALADDWSSWARLIDPRSFESNFWPAGYPGFLALFAWAGDAEIFAIRVAHIVLAASVALMAGVLADSLNRIAGTVTTVVVALSPTAIWAVWAIGYELLLAALLLAGLLLVWRPFRASAPWPPVAGAAGLLFSRSLGSSCPFSRGLLDRWWPSVVRHRGRLMGPTTSGTETGRTRPATTSFRCLMFLLTPLAIRTQHSRGSWARLLISWQLPGESSCTSSSPPGYRASLIRSKGLG